MSLDAASVANLTIEEVLVQDTQRFLQKEMVVYPTLLDLTSRFVRKGQTKCKIPVNVAKNVVDTPSGGTELPHYAHSNSVDELILDQKKTVYDYIYDVEDMEVASDQKADFYADAVPSLAEYIETNVIGHMKTNIAAGNKLQLAGGSNDEISLDQMAALQKIMNVAKVPKLGRYMAVSSKQAEILKKTQDVKDASKFGNNDAIVNGIVAKIYGFNIIESLDLTDNEVMAYSSISAAVALPKAFEREEERQASLKRDFLSIDSVFGRAKLRAGSLIWLLDETVAA